MKINLKLKEFSLVDDAGQLTRNADPGRGRTARYGCGLFQFTK